MDPGRRGQAGPRPGEGQGPLAVLDRRADDDHVADAGPPRPLEHGVPVRVERRVAEVAVGVYEHGARGSGLGARGLGVEAADTRHLTPSPEPPAPSPYTVAFDRGTAAGAGCGSTAGLKARAPRASSPGQRFSMYIRMGAAM